MKNKLFLFALALVSVAYIFSLKGAIWSLLFFLFTWLLNYEKLEFNKERIEKFAVVLFPLFFFIGLSFSLSYTLFPQNGWNKWQRFLTFLLFPIVFISLKKLSDKNYYKLISFYITSISILYLVCLINAVYLQLKFTFDKNGPINWYYFYRFDFLKPFHQHPTYVAMYTILSIGFLLFYRKKIIHSTILFCTHLIIQIIGIILSGSRMGLIVLFLIFLYFFIKEKQIKKLVMFFAGVAISFFLLMQIPIIKERIYISLGKKYDYKFYYQKDFLKKGNPEKQGRLSSWQDALILIKEKPILGYGLGTSNRVLREQYAKSNHQYLIKMGYNAHNSYLQWWLVGGFFLLLVYLGMIASLFYYGIKYKEHILIVFGLIILFFSLTETFFRLQGIIFISFFFTFLIYKTISRKVESN